MPTTRSQARKAAVIMSPNEDVKRYLKEHFEPLARKEDIDTAINTAVRQLEQKIIKTLDDQDQRINSLEQRLDQLEGSLKVNQARCDFLERKTDDLEQYGRRLCIRKDGVEVNEDETAEECTDKVLNMLQKSDVEVSNKDIIDRAHRIGSKRTVSADGKKVQQIIVKFLTWQKPNVVYRSRKVVKEKFGYSVRLDLTKKKLDLLRRARELTEDRPEVDSVFTDINCKLVLKMANDSMKWFSSESELNSILKIQTQ